MLTFLHRIVHWFDDSYFRKLLTNASKLLSATAIASALGLVSVSLSGRILGPHDYGVLALIMAYELTIGKLFEFNAWQAIIKFGSDALHSKDTAALCQLIKFGFVLDLSSALIGTVVAIALAGPIIRLLTWNESIQQLLMLYSLVILFGFGGTPIGVLRLFGRFDLLSISPVLGAIARLLGVIGCALTQQSLSGFVVVYLVTGIVAPLFSLMASAWVLGKDALVQIFAQPLKGIRKRFPGILDFVWTTNFTTTIRMTSREADGLIIAFLVTPESLGLYQVAKTFSSVLPKAAAPFSQAVYPELAKTWASGDKMRFTMFIKRVTAFTTAIGLAGWFAFIVFGHQILYYTVGPEFIGAYWITVVYLLAMVLFLMSIALTPSLLAIGLVRHSFFANLVAVILYFCLLFPLTAWLGAIGASLSYVGFFLAWSAVMYFHLCLAVKQ